MQHKSTPCAKNAVVLNVTVGGTYSYRWVINSDVLLSLVTVACLQIKD